MSISSAPVDSEPAPTPGARLPKALFAGGLLSIVALFLNAPPDSWLGKAKWIGYALCHQMPDRSFFAHEHQYPLCARCTGMYLGFTTGVRCETDQDWFEFTTGPGLTYQMSIGDLETVLEHNPEALIIGIWEIHAHYSAKGYKSHPMNKGGWWRFPFGRVKMVNAVHSSSFPDGSYGGEPVGFVVDAPDGTFYIAGDTALTTDMELIPMTCPPLDLAILPIGSNFTMDVPDAVIASDFIQCDRIIGCHFDSFGFIKIDHPGARAAFAEKGKDLILMQIGESSEF